MEELSLSSISPRSEVRCTDVLAQDPKNHRRQLASYLFYRNLF